MKEKEIEKVYTKEDRMNMIKELLKTNSRTKLKLCKNECYNTRRNGSAYCQECSDKIKV